MLILEISLNFHELFYYCDNIESLCNRSELTLNFAKLELLWILFWLIIFATIIGPFMKIRIQFGFSLETGVPSESEKYRAA